MTQGAGSGHSKVRVGSRRWLAAALVPIPQPVMIETQTMQNGRMQVVNVDLVLQKVAA